MSFLSKIKSAPASMMNAETRHKQGLAGQAVEAVEYIGSSYLAGRINTQLGDHAKFRDVEITYLAGILAKGASLFGLGGKYNAHLSTVGLSLIGAHFAARGAKDGMEARDKASALSGGATRKLTGTMLGSIPTEQRPGKYLNVDQINSLAAMHG